MPDYQSLEDEIKERYGDTPLVSGPVDPDNPTFDSLLGALKAVYTGERGMDILVKYHHGLSKQIEDSKTYITNMKPPDEFKSQSRNR